MKSFQSQMAAMFGVESTTSSDNDVKLEVERILTECDVQASTIAVNRSEVCINLAENCAVCGGRVVSSGTDPEKDSGLVGRILELPQVRSVSVWDGAGRLVQEEKGSKRVEEDVSCTAASIPLWISVVAHRYSNDANREKYAEDFERLEKALVEAGAEEDESLVRAMGRLSQEQIYDFYKAFYRMSS